MLARKFIISSALGLICDLSASALAAETGALAASVDGMHDSNGVLVVAAFDDAIEFEAKDLMYDTAAAIIPTNEERVALTFDDLPTGPYAIAASHDGDSDGDLDLHGEVLTEGYSFASIGRSGLLLRFGDALTVREQKASRTLPQIYWN